MDTAPDRSQSRAADARRRFRRRSQATGDVLALLAAEPRRGRLLELPAGDGVTTQQLVALGYEVVPADLFPEYYRFPAPPCVRMNFLAPLPAPDATFDYVLCQEGIEHMEAPMAFTRECARVLRPGGVLILTTPNVLHLSGRLSYFLVGHRGLRRGLINEHQTLLDRHGAELHHGHAWHWRFHQLRYMLRLSGFAVEPPRTGKYSWVSVLMSGCYPLLWWAHWYACRAALAREPRPELAALARPTLAELRRQSLSRALLWGKKLMLVARREAAPFLDADPYWSRRGTGDGRAGARDRSAPPGP